MDKLLPTYQFLTGKLAHRVQNTEHFIACFLLNSLVPVFGRNHTSTVCLSFTLSLLYMNKYTSKHPIRHGCVMLRCWRQYNYKSVTAMPVVGHWFRIISCLFNWVLLESLYLFPLFLLILTRCRQSRYNKNIRTSLEEPNKQKNCLESIVFITMQMDYVVNVSKYLPSLENLCFFLPGLQQSPSIP